MCGYCIESGDVIDFVQRQELIDKYDNNIVLNYVQECRDLPATLDKLRHMDSFLCTVDTALCRAYEMALRSNEQGIFPILRDYFGQEYLDKLLENLSTDVGCPLLGKLKDPAIYNDSGQWTSFIENRAGLIEDATRLLDYYHQWWLMDDAPTTDRSKLGRIFDIFPMLYFSLIYLMEYQSNAPIIRLLALQEPLQVPTFFGCDLWLRRKAFTHCIQQHGVPFIQENHESIRIVLIRYALAKRIINKTELDQLEEIVLTKYNYEYDDQRVEADNARKQIAQLRDEN